jgi:ribosomal protein L25 (general stress protein Ctc)
MADVTLVVEKRNAAGKGPAGRVRRQGLVPAVVYGLGGDSVPVTASARELGHILSSGSGSNTLITLELDGSSQLALARQIQRHPVKGTLVHVDFIRVRADQTIQAEVPVIYVAFDALGLGAGDGASMEPLLTLGSVAIALALAGCDLPGKPNPVTNLEDPDASVLLGAHTQYWSNALLFDRLHRFVRLTANDGRDFFQLFHFRQQPDRRQQTPRWRHIALPAFPQRQAAQRVSVNAEISSDIGARLFGAFITIAAVCQQFGRVRDGNADGPACARRFFGAGRRRW